MKKDHLLNWLILFLVGAAVAVVAVIQSNYLQQGQEAERAQVKAEVAEAVAAESVAVVAEVEAQNVSLKTALAMEEAQRMQTQELVEFMRNHSDYLVVCANREGQITRVNGNASIIKWSNDGLRRAKVADTILRKKLDSHNDAMQQRAEDGKSGEVHRFFNRAARTEAGGAVNVDGLVLWFHDLGEFMAILAPPKK